MPTITPSTTPIITTPTFTPSITPTLYSSIPITYEEALKASNDEILFKAPRFEEGYDFAKEYSFYPSEGGKPAEVTKLTPSEVVRTGENNKNIYILYKDQDGEVRMLWNMEFNVWEHISWSEYTDPVSGFKIRAGNIVDNKPDTSIEGIFGKWLEIKIPNPNYSFAQAIFDFHFALNNYWNRHQELFEEHLYKLTSNNLNLDFWEDTTRFLLPEEKEQIINKGIEIFREDLEDLGINEELIIPTFEGNTFSLTKGGAIILFRAQGKGEEIYLSNPDGAYNFVSGIDVFNGQGKFGSNEIIYSVYSKSLVEYGDPFGLTVSVGGPIHFIMLSYIPFASTIENGVLIGSGKSDMVFPNLGEVLYYRLFGDEIIEDFLDKLKDDGYLRFKQKSTVPQIYNNPPRDDLPSIFIVRTINSE